MKCNPRLTSLLALALLALSPVATWRAAAQGPALLVVAPAQIAVGGQLTLALTLQNATDLGGYQAILRFDPAAAHFNESRPGFWAWLKRVATGSGRAIEGN